MSSDDHEVRGPHATGVDEWINDVHHGDAFDVLAELPDGSIHAVVTDPPYGLAFMGRDWDTFDPKEYQEWCERWASKARRVLKPGGHLLAFSGNRTHHRLFTGVEDAGFEVRDTLTWHYGSGFPKAADVSKVIDKRADAEREVVGVKTGHEEFVNRDTDGHLGGKGTHEGYKRDWMEKEDADDYHKQTAPATDAAKRWEGWKTGLKPATEFVVMARKPFDGATVDCVLEHGAGALNVGGCLIDGEWGSRESGGGFGASDADYYDNSDEWDGETEGEGRYPANVAFGGRAAEALDAEVGSTSGGDARGVCDGDRPSGFVDVGTENGDGEPNARVYEDHGGPSRYFYTSKATRAERTEDGQIKNDHPTVKPTDLMEWLVKLVTREGQIVLDPFAGTGTTCKAAKSLNRRFIGVEKQARYVAIAQARAGVTVDEPRHLTDSDTSTLRAFADGGST